MDGYPPEAVDDAALVQRLAEETRARIQTQLDDLLAERRSVWLG